MLNNLGSRVPMGKKVEFLKPYKFTIAYENRARLGYTTEKIAEPMLADSVPIYWGNRGVDLDFNPSSFVNWHSFGDDDQLIDYIVQLDRCDDLYLDLLRQPWYHNNVANRYIAEEIVLDWFARIIEGLH